MVTDKKLLWAISFHHLCNDGTLMALVALLPVLVKEMNVSYYDVGLLGFGLIITVVVQYGVGKVADRRFSKYLLEIGAALMASSFFLLLMVNDFSGLFSVVIIMRIGAAFYHPVGTSWITRAFAGPYLDTALGVQSGVGNLGVIIAWSSSGFLGELYGWKIPCMIWAVLNFTAVLVGLSVIKETGIKLHQLRLEGRIRSRDTLRKIGLLTVPVLSGGALYQVTSYFGPLNLTRNAGWTPGSADLMFAVWIGVGTMTSYYFGAISARYSRSRLLKSAYLASSVAALILATANQWFLVAPVLAVFGAFLYLTYPALFAMVTAATEERERGTAFGILFGFQLGGGAATVYLCGIIAELTGNPGIAFVIVSAMAVVSIAAFVFWERRRGIDIE